MGCSRSSASLTRPQSQSAASSSGSQAPLHPAGHPSTPARPPMPLTKQLSLHSDSTPEVGHCDHEQRLCKAQGSGGKGGRLSLAAAVHGAGVGCCLGHVHAHAPTRLRTHKYMHAHVHPHVCTQAHAYTCMHPHVHTNTYPHTCARTLACTQVHASAYMHTCTPAWMHAHAHPRACTTHTCACACIVNPHVCTARTCAHAPTPMYMPHIHVCAHTCMHMLTCMHTHTHAEMSHHSDKGLHFVTPVECLFVFLYSFITGHIFNSFTEV